MYIHGGGFINEITKIHYKFIYRLIKETGATVYVPIYPLARKDFSNIEPSLTMFIEIYKIMIAKYSKISLMGDSAGGSFVLALAQMIKKQQLKIPNEVIAISPCVKACKTSIDETKKYANNDAYLP
jgi:acetyl esterase/lipase